MEVDGFKRVRDVQYLDEQDHKHGDMVIARTLKVESMACDVESTSKAHRMCVVQVTIAPDNADQSAQRGSSEASGSAAQPAVAMRLSSGVSGSAWRRTASGSATKPARAVKLSVAANGSDDELDAELSPRKY